MITRPGRQWVALLLLLTGALGCVAATASEVLNGVRVRGEIKVCIWPDYQRISWRDPRSDQLSGPEIDLAAALASDLHIKLPFIDSSFTTSIQDLQTDHCDVAMFGIAMLPQRMEHLQFSTPYLQSDIDAVTTRTSRIVRQWSDIDQPGMLVGVLAGTFMEPIMSELLRHAELVSIKPPRTRERELISGRIDTFMTDYPYGRSLSDNTDWATLLAPTEPFHVLPYAHASKPGNTKWRAMLNAFIARFRQDGRLDAAARRNGLESILLH